MTKHDLVVIDADYIGAYQSLDRIASGFAENAQVVEDVQDALGHPGLASEFKTFSDSWRIKRDAMQKAFEALSKGIKTQYDTWVDRDTHLNQDPSTDSSTSQSTSDTTPTKESTSTTSSSTSTTSSSTSTTPTAPTTSTGGSALPTASATDPGTSGSTPGTGTATVDPGSGTATTDSGASADASTGAAAPVAAMTGAGVLGAIYALWKNTQDGKTSAGGAGTTDAGSALSVRDRITQELAQLKGVADSGYTVELTADPKDPDDIMAVLRGKDGDTLTLSMDDADQNGASADAAAGAQQPEAGAQQADAAAGTTAQVADLGPAGGANGAAEAAPATAASAPEALAAPAASSADGASATSAGTPSAVGGGGLTSPLAASGASVNLPDAAPSVAGGTTATTTPVAAASAGMMGMGALSAQHMMTASGGGTAAPRSREQLRPAEPVRDDDAEGKDQK